ncbi:MAG: hypothetical protein M3R36_02410 [Bacteroidota bacterium]|nr:hypothetical protein [Bacteroidota bacterium]
MFILISTNSCFSQNDSDKIKIGPDELQISKGPRYFNFADKNKVNIEIIVLGLAAGKYLIPQGTTLFDLLIMVGGTEERTVDEIKILRFKSDTPILKANEVKNYNYSDLYGNDQDMLRPQKNPMLKPGDMVILPPPRDSQQSVFYYIREVMSFIVTIVSFYYLIDNLIYRNRF